jgi:histidine phosphotransferase ChpT
MTTKALLEDVDLAALLCSRVCHDVISPVGAIANGLEVLEDEDDAEMRQIAFDLIAQSAKAASAKLQFCRMAFGAAGSMGSLIDMGEAGDITKMFIGDEKITLNWNAPRAQRSKSEVKLLLNMVLMGMSSIPRGGDIIVDADDTTLTVKAVGDRAGIPEKMLAVMKGEFEASDLDARLVQVYYAMRLAQEAKAEMTADMSEAAVTFTASVEAKAAEQPIQQIA